MASLVKLIGGVAGVDKNDKGLPLVHLWQGGTIVADFKKWMVWGADKIDPDGIDAAVNGAGTSRHPVCKKFKAEWIAAVADLKTDKVKPEVFSKNVGEFFWKYYFSIAFAKYTNGLPTVTDAALKNKKLKLVEMKFNTKNLASLIREYDKTTASAFHGAANNEGKRGPLTDFSPQVKLGSSVPTLEHRILKGKERLWWATSTKVIYTTSGHLGGKSAPERKVHEDLVNEVNGLGTASTTVAYSELADFAGQLFAVS